MRVKLKCARVGNRAYHETGEVIDVPDAEGRRLVEADQAVEVNGPSRIEAAAETAAENAVRRVRGRPRTAAAGTR